MPACPRRIDHDRLGKIAHETIHAGEGFVVQKLGARYRDARSNPRAVVVGRTLISNAREHILNEVVRGREGGREGKSGNIWPVLASYGSIVTSQQLVFSKFDNRNEPHQ